MSLSEPTPGPGPDDTDVVEVDDIDEEDDWDGEWSLETRNSTSPEDYSSSSPGIVERKTKREHIVYDADIDTWDNPQVSFKVKVQFFVSAYISWPEKLTPCDYSTKVIGYVLRYSKKGDAMNYETLNLSDNFVVLGNLEPDSYYVYQVKYVLVSGPDSDWSTEATLSTYYTART